MAKAAAKPPKIADDVAEQVIDQVTERITSRASTWSTWLKILSFVFVTIGGSVAGYAYALGQANEAITRRITTVEKISSENSAEIDVLVNDQQILREIVLEFRASAMTELRLINKNLDRLNDNEQ